jgi:hypothetical protein
MCCVDACIIVVAGWWVSVCFSGRLVLLAFVRGYPPPTARGGLGTEWRKCFEEDDPCLGLEGPLVRICQLLEPPVRVFIEH